VCGFDLGSCTRTAGAPLGAAPAYGLSRLKPQTPRREVRGERRAPLACAHGLGKEARPLLAKRLGLGTDERVAARLLAVRRPAASVKARRRQARAGAQPRGDTPARAPLPLRAWNLFLPKVAGTVWTAPPLGKASALSGQVEGVFKAWKSPLPLATLTTTTKPRTLGELYGRRLLSVVTFALGPTLRATVWQPPREVRLVKLVRHFPAGAEQWLRVLFQSPRQLTAFLSQACAAAERLVRKAVRKRGTSAHHLRASLASQVDSFEPTLALAA
jgi:hypothetical protein